MTEPVSYNQLISSLDQKLFDEISAELKINKKNHKITGQSLFTMLLYNICETNRVSLRVMENSFKAHSVEIKYQGKSLKMSKSGIANRLATINPDFFKKILENVIVKTNSVFKKDTKHQIIRCDSTIVTLSSKLAQVGIPVSNGPKHQVKLAVAFNDRPIDANVVTESKDFSEEYTLKKLILQNSGSKEDIFVFDRGLCSRATYAELSQKNISFVTRLKDNTTYSILKILSNDVEFTETLEITSDSIVQLFTKSGWICPTNFRLIKAINLKSGQELRFLTNIMDLSATEITEIYRSRWDIEVFFKFIKQHLNAKHLLSRNKNGITVIFYTMLIASILMLAFKKMNNIESYLITKLQFIEQLKRVLSYELILIYKDRPDAFKTRFLS